MPWFKWVAVSADLVFQKLKASLCLVLIRRTQRTNPGLGGKTQMSWDIQCFIDKYLIICPLKHRQPVQWCNELHCRRLEDFQHQLNDKWPDSLKVRKESFFKKKQKTTCIHIQEDRKKNVTWNRVKLICIARFGLQLTGSLKYHLPSSSWLQIWALVSFLYLNINSLHYTKITFISDSHGGIRF